MRSNFDKTLTLFIPFGLNNNVFQGVFTIFKLVHPLGTTLHNFELFCLPGASKTSQLAESILYFCTFPGVLEQNFVFPG